MTTDPHDEHGEILRRALNAEADSVNPAGDGLERIRARIADGSGRRFGLGRFAPARFGFDRFTVNWARPVLAVAAAVAVAGLGVTAPQTIDLIQQSVGSNGPSGEGKNNTSGDHAGAQGNPQFPGPASPGGTATDAPSSSQTPTSAASPGLSACSIPRPPTPPTVTASPGAEPAATPSVTPCPDSTPSQQPTTTPSPPTSTSPEPDKPSDAPTSPSTSEPAKSTDQGAGAAAGAP
ncbi:MULTISPECIES: hypothetical protein [unclassified Spirillospora]|uniref:hypothetical protein n=1 Tax=unclassified Spirillospora TaxID=2642701 RepID=UPI00371DD3F4